MSGTPRPDGIPPDNPAAAGASVALEDCYQEMLKIARQQMAGERRSHTLQPTALVNEAWLRLQAVHRSTTLDRASFLQAATTAMRRILIDHARGHRRDKRGGGRQRVVIDANALLEAHDLAAVVEVDDAIELLAQRDPYVARIVRMRFYLGLQADEIAASLGVSERAVFRELAYGKAVLARMLGAEER
jgi:RNA polymerase sigma factor (TIGR02999 family)